MSDVLLGADSMQSLFDPMSMDSSSSAPSSSPDMSMSDPLLEALGLTTTPAALLETSTQVIADTSGFFNPLTSEVDALESAMAMVAVPSFTNVGGASSEDVESFMSLMAGPVPLASSNDSSTVSGLWDAGILPDTSFSLDPATYNALNMDSGMYSFLASDALGGSMPVLPDLEPHLMSLAMGPGFHSLGIPQVLGQLPSGVADLMCAVGAQLSAHPGLDSQYGGRIRAMRHFMDRATRAFDDKLQNAFKVSPAVIHAMLSLGCLEFMLGDYHQACRWISDACNRCEHSLYNRHALPREFAGFKKFDAIRDEMEWEKEARWNVYAHALEVDTLTSFASNFAFDINEMEAPHMLYERRPWESPNDFATRAGRDAQSNMRSPRPPELTIFDQFPGSARQAPPSFLTVNPSRATAIVVQISFLKRRVLRFTRSPAAKTLDADEGDTGIGAATILAITPVEADILTIHDSILAWYKTLPASVRLFRSFALFRDPPTPEILNGSSSGLGHLPWCITVILIMSLLHSSHNTPTFGCNYRIDAGTAYPMRVTSNHILTVCRRALSYCLRSFLSRPLVPSPLIVDAGYGARMAALPFSAEHPALPQAIQMLPAVGLHIVAIVAAEMTSPEAPVAEALADIQDLYLPILDSVCRNVPVELDSAMKLRGLVAEGMGGQQVELHGNWRRKCWRGTARGSANVGERYI
ncbi:hypothetical protein HKX48_005267 [Thoreauomyces humboldtii]|nr:hypothetical protein HKX48_005267 [Thoreauomyces humboldtii]